MRETYLIEMAAELYYRTVVEWRDRCDKGTSDWEKWDNLLKSLRDLNTQIYEAVK